MKILALAGDGIGPEVVSAGLKVLEAAVEGACLELDVTEDLIGGICWDTHGTFIREDTVSAAKAADAVLVGAVGGAKWDGIRVPGGPEMQDGLMRLRMELDTYIGLRPATAHPALASFTPFRPELLEGADVMVMREMCGGAFFGEPRGIDRAGPGGRKGYDLSVYDEHQIARFARAGFELARRRRRKIVSADKANVMETYVLWREVVSEVATEYPDVELTIWYADNTAYQLCRQPADFDIILADNLFGDILSDQAGAVAGSLGMLPSACLSRWPAEGEPAGPAIYEPVHGSAPDIAGRGLANPYGTILSIAMMADYGFGRRDIARRIETATRRAIEAGALGFDLGGEHTTAAITDAVIKELRA